MTTRRRDSMAYCCTRTLASSCSRSGLATPTGPLEQFQILPSQRIRLVTNREQSGGRLHFSYSPHFGVATPDADSTEQVRERASNQGLAARKPLVFWSLMMSSVLLLAARLITAARSP